MGLMGLHFPNPEDQFQWDKVPHVLHSLNISPLMLSSGLTRIDECSQDES